MTWLLHRRQRRRLAGVLWRGRRRALRIVTGYDEVAHEENRQKQYFTCVGIHGALDEDSLSESLADACVLHKEEQVRRGDHARRFQRRHVTHVRE